MKKIVNLKRGFFIVVASSILFISCHKEGTGGKSSVSGLVRHHSMVIPNCTVYIKYGTKDFPGTNVSSYDSYVTVDGSGHYEIKDLRRGDYYLYGTGYDNTIMETVSGGVGVTLRYNKNSDIDVPVTE